MRLQAVIIHLVQAVQVVIGKKTMQMRISVLLSIATILLLSCCLRNKSAIMTLEQYSQKLLADSVSYQYRGLVFGPDRNEINFTIKFPDSIQVFYNLESQGKVNITSIDNTKQGYDSIDIVKKVQRITNFLRDRQIYIIDGKKEYMEVVFDLNVIGQRKTSEFNRGVLVFCYEDADTVLRMGKIIFHKPIKLLPGVLYYEYK